MHEYLMTLFVAWFEFVRDWGYLGVFLLMALESSIVPIPSEIVMPPAAYWAMQGQMSFAGVVLAGTFGSLFGSVVSYIGASYLGRPFVNRFGRYVLLGQEKIAQAEELVKSYGSFGIFSARLLPVVRHLISIPAGLLRMGFKNFCLMTTLGAGVWCFILSWFGAQLIGDRPDLLSDPAVLVAACKEKLHLFLGGVVLFILSYLVTVMIKTKRRRR